ncbi:MAG: hypothetical protein Q9226_006681 [Calogaya cf. arnoldii]
MSPCLTVFKSRRPVDLVCVGFGPAALGIGVALQDACERSTVPLNSRSKLAFIESQATFAWHVGMQLPGAKIQIGLIKDLATQRDPRSRFTFLNYLWTKGRLNQYANLSTIRPSRIEYQDYMSWCAESFLDLVHYGEEFIDVSPVRQSSQSQLVESFLGKDPLRTASITRDKATNYGVVRLALIEKIYEDLYTQSLLSPRGAHPQNQILRYRTVTGHKSSASGAAILILENATSQYEKTDEPVDEQLEFDAVILATGYVRDLHLEMLKPLYKSATSPTN